MSYVAGPRTLGARLRGKARRAIDRAHALAHPQTAYPRWRDRMLATEWPAIDLRFGAGTDLVLGLATGYRYDTLQPFVSTLRKASNCRALLVVDDAALATRLAGEGIDTVMWRRAPGYSPHANFARIGVLLAALRAVRSVDRAFVVDTRDVVFQSDPFDAIEGGRLRFFTEAIGQTFRSDRTNRSWLMAAMGPESLSLFGDFDIVCAGTVAGGIDALVEYLRLKLFVGALFGPTRHLGTGLDQLTTNLIARYRMLPEAEIMPFDGPVATTCFANDGMLLQDPDGYFRFINGVRPAIIHQWDRSSVMWRWFLGPDA